ncbi:MAG: FAD binding domain-containing protein [Acidimicrobiales bacterium]
MKPAPFDYLDPPDLEGVLAALHSHGDDAAVIGGGQSLVPLLNLRLARPDVVIDPRHVSGLDAITLQDGTVEVGARVTATDLVAHAGVTRAVPGLVEAARDIGHVQIRNRTTVGGSIAHADPAAELPAALVGLDGSVVLHAASGRRVVAAADFFQGAFTTGRRPDELVTSARFEVPAGRSGWVEQARRPGDFALVGVFAALGTAAEGRVSSVAIALSGVGSRPLRASRAEARLAGRPLTVEAIGEAAAAVRTEIEPADDVHATAEHRAALAEVLTRRLLTRLAEGAS